MYRMVQTGANSQFGGLKNGLFKVENQLSIEVTVDVPDKKPITKQIETAIIILTGSGRLFIYKYYLKIDSRKK